MDTKELNDIVGGLASRHEELKNDTKFALVKSCSTFGRYEEDRDGGDIWYIDILGTGNTIHTDGTRCVGGRLKFYLNKKLLTVTEYDSEDKGYEEEIAIENLDINIWFAILRWIIRQGW